MSVLTDLARSILDDRCFPTVATVNPDGSPQASIVWVLREDDAILFSSLASRRRIRNLARDPRLTIAVFSPGNPYQAVEIRGRAELIEDRAKELPRRLSQKYLGSDPPPEPEEQLRYMVRITPEKVLEFSA